MATAEQRKLLLQNSDCPATRLSNECNQGGFYFGKVSVCEEVVLSGNIRLIQVGRGDFEDAELRAILFRSFVINENMV